MYIKVKVKAGANKEVVDKINDNHYNISIKEKAERNMANERVCQIIAGILGVNVGKVRIINGHHSPSKLISVMTLD